jgi:hypothetical protein
MISRTLPALALALSLGCGGATPTPQDVRDWTTTGVTVASAAIELTQAILALVEQIQGTAKCVTVDDGAPPQADPGEAAPGVPEDPVEVAP